MNYSLLTVEILTALLGLGVLLLDLWLPTASRKLLGIGAATGLGVLLVYAVGSAAPADGTAFGGMFISDALSSFAKGFFLLAGLIVLLMSVDAADTTHGYAEYCALVLFALTGMLFAASANDFVLMFVALELITVTFYILVSFQRNRLASLEAGVKYLILGALASGFMVFGMALIFGSANTTNFYQIAAAQSSLIKSPVFLTGILLIVVGLGFKIAAFPFQIWASDVYQGAPALTTSFLATGSKAAGIILLARVAFGAVPELTVGRSHLFLAIGALTILYGSLCAIPQRSVKRLMGYSSIANAGYLLLGFGAASLAGGSAVLAYLGGYIFTVLAAFAAIQVVVAHQESDDITAFAGLARRSPWLATGLTVGLVSLAGIPPVAGFFGQLMILKAVAVQAGSSSFVLFILLVAVLGVVVGLYYYLGVLRAVYWPRSTTDLSPIPVSFTTKLAIIFAVVGTVLMGVLPETTYRGARQAIAGLATPAAVLPAATAPAQASK